MIPPVKSTNSALPAPSAARKTAGLAGAACNVPRRVANDGWAYGCTFLISTGTVPAGQAAVPIGAVKRRSDRDLGR